MVKKKNQIETKESFLILYSVQIIALFNAQEPESVGCQNLFVIKSLRLDFSVGVCAGEGWKTTIRRREVQKGIVWETL